VTIRGTVVRASSIRPLVTQLNFLCPKCGEVSTQQLVDGVYQPPASCGGDGCRGRTFLPQRKSAKTIDWQKLRIQVQFHTVVCSATLGGGGGGVQHKQPRKTVGSLLASQKLDPGGKGQSKNY